MFTTVFTRPTGTLTTPTAPLKVRVPLSKLAGRQALRRWYPLLDEKNEDSGNLGKRVRGEVELQLRWVHQTARVQVTPC